MSICQEKKKAEFEPQIGKKYETVCKGLDKKLC